MIDRINETSKLESMIATRTRIILVSGEEGVGKSYFVDQKCKDECLLIKRDSIYDNFSKCLIKALLSDSNDNFIKYINFCNDDYRLVSHTLNKLCNGVVDELCDMFNTETLLTYKSVKKVDKKAQTSVKKITFPLLLTEYIKTLNKKIIVYDNFNDDEDIANLIPFAIKEQDRINIIITQSSSLKKKYASNLIYLDKFNDPNAERFSQLLINKIPIKSVSCLQELALGLQHFLDGRPKALEFFLARIQDQLLDCKTDDDYKNVINTELSKDSQLINDIFIKQFMQILYFFDGPVNINKITSFISEVLGYNSNTIKLKIDLMFRQELINSYGINDIICTARGKVLINGSLFKDINDIVRVGRNILAELDKISYDKLIQDNIALQLISSICEHFYSAGITASSYYHYVKLYADYLISQNKLTKAAHLFAVSWSTLKYEPYDYIKIISDLLYEHGYYKECYNLLVDYEEDALTNHDKYDIYMKIANCSCLIDNIKSLEYYDKAIALNTTHTAVAISCKLLAWIEQCLLSEIDMIRKEYNTVLSKYKDSCDVTGYVALLRNSLDFQSNEEAIKSMRKALEIISEYNIPNEEYKVKQNLSLNLIRCGNFKEAERLLTEVRLYCEQYAIKELSYPLINLSVISIYHYLETSDERFLDIALKHSMRAQDYASSYYATTLSNIQYLTALSLKYQLHPEKLVLRRIKDMRNYWQSQAFEGSRLDNRIIRKILLSLIASCRITNDLCEAENYLRKLYNHKNMIGKESVKVNLLIKKLGLLDLIELPVAPTDIACNEYNKEIRFEPWLISLTHY